MRCIMKDRQNDETDFLKFHMKHFSVLDVQEKERQRIARDLHDISLQDLTHLIHKVELSSLYIDKDTVKAKLELATIEAGLRKAIVDIRNIIYDLRPMTFDDLGLRDTLLNFFSLINREYTFKIVSDIDDIDNQISYEKKDIVLVMIYRIIQECVYNSLKHSKGNLITVTLKSDDKNFLINVKDNGVGFNKEIVEREDKHFGLVVLKERVFLLNGDIIVNTDDGTSIYIEIPKK